MTASKAAVFPSAFELFLPPIAAFGFIALFVMVVLWLEIKIASHIQARYGYMVTGGWHGWAQPIADMVKLLVKESFIPDAADKWVFILAPFVVFVPAFLAYVVVPFGPNLIAADLNIGLFYFLAVPSLGVVGLIMAGLSSGNKYSLMGGLRAAAQLISYEIPRALSVIGVVMMAGTLSLVQIVNEQDRMWFVLPQIIGFFVYYISSIAETNRVPFDIPEAESELVSGFSTEYSGIRFAIFFMAEYANVFAAGAVGTVLFFGGWNGPFLPPVVWMILKVFLIFILPFIWVRWTLPRFRPDQLMSLCWKVLLPLALFNLGLTGVMIVMAKGWIGG